MKNIYALLIIALFCVCISDAQTPQLWGTTSSGGGVDTGGTIFRINLDGSNFTTAHSFDTLGGYGPYGSLIQAPNGLLYGMTEDGGNSEAGVIFSYDPVSHSYAKHFDFDYYSKGGFPEGKLLAANDGKLYGMTSDGGLNQSGTIFSFDPAGNSFQHLFDFDDASGKSPFGSLIQASNGKLYGLTSDGGTDSAGTLFSYDISNGTFTVLHNFSAVTGMTPTGSLLIADNGKMYGLTSAGGAYDYGVVFSFDASGNVYADLHDLTGTEGSAPYGSLIQFADGLLYGMASGGGTCGIFGTIFNFNPLTNAYSDIFDFSGSDGSSPGGDLLQGSNGKLYGMTVLGGANDNGVLFSYDPSNSGYADLVDFNIANGQYPWASVIEIIATGIPEKYDAASIQLYPNPVNKDLRIRNNGGEVKRIDIFNIVGERVYSNSLEMQAFGQLTIDVSSLASGVYFVHAQRDKGNWEGKFVKQ
jgi:uncharacterized repeat protein (TIGR03803 family)